MSEQTEDMVYLAVGPDYDDAELIRRADLPDYAFPAALTVKSDALEGGADRSYEVWAIEG